MSWKPHVTVWADGGCVGQNWPRERMAERIMYGSWKHETAQGKVRRGGIEHIEGEWRTSQLAELVSAVFALEDLFAWMVSEGKSKGRIRRQAKVLLLTDSQLVWTFLKGGNCKTLAHKPWWRNLMNARDLFQELRCEMRTDKEVKAVLGH